MKRQTSSSSGKQRKRLTLNPSPGSASKRKTNYAPPARISNQADSDFGEEIEDQYYKRSIPSGGGLLLLSPKRSSEPPNLAASIVSPTNNQAQHRDLPLDLNAADGGGEEDDGVDIHQFAHLSVDEDDESEELMEGDDLRGINQGLAEVDGEEFGEGAQEFLGAGDMIELEDESDEENQFNEAHFKRFQEQMLEEQADFAGGTEFDKQKAMLDLLGETEQLMESQGEDSLQDDYGMAEMLSSHKRRESSNQASSVVSPVRFRQEGQSSAMGQSKQQPMELRKQQMNAVDSDSPEGLGMMRGEAIESYISDAHPHEILETEKTNNLNQDLDSHVENSKVESQQEVPNQVQLLPTNTKLTTHVQRNNGQQIPPISVQSFVRLEGKLPHSQPQSKKRDHGTTEQTTSMLQQTPSQDATNPGMEPIVEEPAVVKVSQFTDQSKSGKKSDQNDEQSAEEEDEEEVSELRFHPSNRNFEFEQELLDQDDGRAQADTVKQSPNKIGLESNDPGSVGIDLNQVQKLSNQTYRNEGQLAQTLQSEFNETKGAELALRDLLKSSKVSQGPRSSQYNSSQHIQFVDNDEAEKSANCGPEGHDTPDSMNHYSREESILPATAAGAQMNQVVGGGLEDANESTAMVNTGSSGGEDEVSSLRGGKQRIPNLQLEQKLPPNFSQTIHSGRSSIKPDEIRGTATTGGPAGGALDRDASRAFLQDQEINEISCKPDQQDISQPQKTQEWSSEFTEFKSNINFEFKNRYATGLADEEANQSFKENEGNSNSGLSQSQNEEDEDDDKTIDLEVTQHLQTHPLKSNKFENSQQDTMAAIQSTKFQMRHHHRHQVNSPSAAHEYEAVALESELGNPAANFKSKSKTAIGFHHSSGKKSKRKQDIVIQKSEQLKDSPSPPKGLVSDSRQQQKSRVDQKRQIDSKLSIVRRNAEKLRQKRKETSYKQTSAATRTKSQHRSVAGVNLSTSANSSKPKALNLSRMQQTSQKVISTAQNLNNDRAPLPKPASSAAIRQGTAKAVTHNIAKPKAIPKQALLNAQKSMKQMQRTTAQSTTSNNNKGLPAALQRMTTVKGGTTSGKVQMHTLGSRDSSQGAAAITRIGANIKQHYAPQAAQNAMLRSQQTGQGSLSQTTFEYNQVVNGVGVVDNQADVKSYKSMQANDLAASSLHGAKNTKKNQLQNSAKTRILDVSPADGSARQKVQQLKFDLNVSSSQASIYQNTNNQSLQKLQEKYRRGSPRVIDDDVAKQPMSKQAKPSMSSVFDKIQTKTHEGPTQASKPPRANYHQQAKLTAAEVREQTKLDNQEQVLKVQLEKIESKLDQKRREVSTSSLQTRKTYQTPSMQVESRYTSQSRPHQTTSVMMIQPTVIKLGDQSFASSNILDTSQSTCQVTTHVPNGRVQQFRKTEVQSSHAKMTNSVAESISKYKKKRMESLSNLAHKAASNTMIAPKEKSLSPPPKTQIARKQEEVVKISQLLKEQQSVQQPIEQQVIEEEKKESPEKIYSKADRDKSKPKPKGSISIPSTKPVFESPRGTTNNSQIGATSNGNGDSISGMPMTDKPVDGRRGQAIGPALSHRAENGTEEDQTERLSDQAARDAENESQQDTDLLHSARSPAGQQLRYHAEQKDNNMGSGSSKQHEYMGFENSMHKEIKKDQENMKAKTGYLALRNKNSATLKNGDKFQSLKNYVEKYDRLKALQEPSSSSQLRLRRTPSVNDTGSPATANNQRNVQSPQNRHKNSPDFSQVVKTNESPESNMKRMAEATFKPNQEDEQNQESALTQLKHQKAVYSGSKKDEKKDEEQSSMMVSNRKKVETQSDLQQQQQSPPARTSLTPFLKDSSSQVKPSRKKQKQDRSETSGGKKNTNRSYMTAAGARASVTTKRGPTSPQQARQDQSKTSMFLRAKKSSPEKPKKFQSSSVGTSKVFFQSNLFKKLTSQANNSRADTDKTNETSHNTKQYDSIDLPSRLSNAAVLNDEITKQQASKTINHDKSHISSLNISENIGQAAMQPQGFSRLRPSRSGTQTAIMQKPPKSNKVANNKVAKTTFNLYCSGASVGNKFNERNSSNPNILKGVDFIEETKDYQKVIHDLKDLLDNPRQHKPLGAASTSNISYHTSGQQQAHHQTMQHKSAARMTTSPTSVFTKRNSTAYEPNQKTIVASSRNYKNGVCDVTATVQSRSPEIRLSPRMAKQVQGQLLPNQKRAFNAKALISIPISSGSASVANKTIQYKDRHSMAMVQQASKKIGAAVDHYIEYSEMDNKDFTTGAAYSTISPRSRLRTITADGDSTLCLRRPTSRQTEQNNITLTSNQAANRMRNGRKSAANHTHISLPSHGNFQNTSQRSTLSKAEQRRKEQFDKSLQREVQKIEEVISHKTEAMQRRRQTVAVVSGGCGSLETPAMINNYVDSLKIPYEKQSIVNVEQNSSITATNIQSHTESDEVLRTMTDVKHEIGGSTKHIQPKYVTTASENGENQGSVQHQPPLQSNQLLSKQKSGAFPINNDTIFNPTSSTEEKTQILLRQIQELQPMVLEAQTKNRQAENQINELMGLQQDISKLQVSSSGPGSSYLGGANIAKSNSNCNLASLLAMNRQESKYGSVHQIEANEVPISMNGYDRQHEEEDEEQYYAEDSKDEPQIFKMPKHPDTAIGHDGFYPSQYHQRQAASEQLAKQNDEVYGHQDDDFY